MKNGECPKCGGAEIFATRDDQHIENSPINDRRLIALKLFACAGCGYMEQYIQDRADLSKLGGLDLVERV